MNSGEHAQFGDGRQHDAQEFLSAILESLVAESNRLQHAPTAFEQAYTGENMMMDEMHYHMERRRLYCDSPVEELFSVDSTLIKLHSSTPASLLPDQDHFPNQVLVVRLEEGNLRGVAPAHAPTTNNSQQEVEFRATEMPCAFIRSRTPLEGLLPLSRMRSLVSSRPEHGYMDSTAHVDSASEAISSCRSRLSNAP